MKNLAKYLLLLILSVVLIHSCDDDPLNGSISSLDCEDTNCIDYSSQAEAQADYNWNPDCRGDLDADNDGIACEENSWTEYYNSISGNNTGGNNTGGNSTGGGDCPSTANCGCSNKTKSECENDSCCQWIVGEGCKCA